MQPWLDMMFHNGWDVVATDYAGLGTRGRQEYLNGVSESRDVVYSVEAARSYRPAMASANWVAWGHSYGGHAVLWAASEAPRISHELHLLGVVAAAPVANVVALAGAQGQAWAPSLAAQEPPIETAVPVLLIQGNRDIAAPLANTRIVDARWCSKGADVNLIVFSRATHVTVTSVGSATMVHWISRRFNHRVAIGNCKR
ncbi:MAG: prolyl oligopeptidase family serine peptidase [Acidimicrobiaceae bacterium]|nr:prolyl oligopeptidase family serine peptidase [Acidimicrobiaceae bacterium]